MGIICPRSGLAASIRSQSQRDAERAHREAQIEDALADYYQATAEVAAGV